MCFPRKKSASELAGGILSCMAGRMAVLVHGGQEGAQELRAGHLGGKTEAWCEHTRCTGHTEPVPRSGCTGSSAAL